MCLITETDSLIAESNGFAALDTPRHAQFPASPEGSASRERLEQSADRAHKLLARQQVRVLELRDAKHQGIHGRNTRSRRKGSPYCQLALSIGPVIVQFGIALVDRRADSSPSPVRTMSLRVGCLNIERRRTALP